MSMSWEEYQFAAQVADQEAALLPVGPVVEAGWYDPDCVACQGDHHFWCRHCGEIVGHGHVHAESHLDLVRDEKEL